MTRLIKHWTICWVFISILSIELSHAQDVELPEAAVPIFVNSAQYLSNGFEIVNEEDWFVFYAMAGFPYDISIPDNSVVHAIDPQLELFDEQGKLIRKHNFGFAGEGELLSISSINDSGFYYLRVTNGVNLSGPYQLHVFLPFAPQGGAIKGKVIDLCTKNAIARASVSTGTLFSNSHTSGEFFFGPINPGRHVVSVSSANYQPSQITTDVLDQELSNTSVELVPKTGCPPIVKELPAVYDSNTGLLDLDVVQAGEQFYKVQLQNEFITSQFVFSLNAPQLIETAVSITSGQYNFDTRLLTVPVVQAFERKYSVTFSHNGDFRFNLDTAVELE